MRGRPALFRLKMAASALEELVDWVQSDAEVGARRCGLRAGAPGEGAFSLGKMERALDGEGADGGTGARACVVAEISRLIASTACGLERGRRGMDVVELKGTKAGRSGDVVDIGEESVAR